MENAISVKNLCKVYETKGGDVIAADHISFDVPKGDIFGIIGLSGAGKSTLVRCLNLLEKPTSGEVFVEGQKLTELSEKELRLARRDIGMIFQHFNLLMQRSVIDNVCFPMEIAGMKKKEAREKAMELLFTVGLADKAKAYPAQLSGGQKQRVAIARVLASDPKVLLCDEATSALDPQTTKSILGLLKEINQKYGITIVLITHEMTVIQEICRHVLVLEGGKLMESGTVEELFRAPKTEAARKLLVNANATIRKMEGGKIVRVSFTPDSSYEPVIGNAVLLYKMPVNILYADMKNINGHPQGEMLIQLPEDKTTAAQMIDYFVSRKLSVEAWEENVR